MTSPDTLAPLLERIDTLTKIVEESQYLTADERKNFLKEISVLTEKVKEGKVTFVQAEKAMSDINKNAALKEMDILISKIGQINPSSPRPETIRKFIQQLKREEITPEAAREDMRKLMQG